MPRRIIWLILTLFVISLVCYVFYYNPQPVTVSYSSSGSMTYPMALFLIIAFVSGFTLTALFAFLFEIEYLRRLWTFSRKERKMESYRSLIISARELYAAGMHGAARERFSKILQRDPRNTVARIELAQSFLQECKPTQALQVLEEARTEDKSNLELLFLAAEVNLRLGNPTGAYDNFQLILRREPRSPRALAGVVSCCKVLERYEEAVQFQVQLLRAARGEDQTKLQEELADLEVRAVTQKFGHLRAGQSDNPGSNREYRKAVEDILVRHRDFPPALRLLAVEDREALKLDAAAKLLLRAFRYSRSVLDLELLADLWLQAEEPTRAIAAVRTSVEQDESSQPRDKRQLEARLFLVALLVFLESMEEAKKERKKLDASIVDHYGLGFGLQIIDSWLTYREGEVDSAYQELFQSLAEDSRLPGYSLFSTKGAGDGLREHWVSRLKSRRAIEWQPTPELSTP